MCVCVSVRLPSRWAFKIAAFPIVNPQAVIGKVFAPRVPIGTPFRSTVCISARHSPTTSQVCVCVCVCVCVTGVCLYVISPWAELHISSIYCASSNHWRTRCHLQREFSQVLPVPVTLPLFFRDLFMFRLCFVRCTRVARGILLIEWNVCCHLSIKRTITKFKFKAQSGVFRRDGKLVAVGSDDVVKVFRASGGSTLRIFKGTAPTRSSGGLKMCAAISRP